MSHCVEADTRAEGTCPAIIRAPASKTQNAVAAKTSGGGFTSVYFELVRHFAELCNLCAQVGEIIKVDTSKSEYIGRA